MANGLSEKVRSPPGESSDDGFVLARFHVTLLRSQVNWYKYSSESQEFLNQ